MEEAVEICQLRLFLKLAAQVEPDPAKDNLGIEPLPDIDFNIRAGNTLVGYATLEEIKKSMEGDWVKQLELPRIQEQAEIAGRAFRQFHKMQTEQGMDGREFFEAKRTLGKQLKALEDELNRFLANEYGIDTTSSNGKRTGKERIAYVRWVKSHQPFHWFVEFFGIMESGGFDVIIGNPPYVEYKDINSIYTVTSYQSLPCGDLYAFCTERALNLLRPKGNLGLIVPISIFGVDGFGSLQKLVLRLLNPIWISCFANRPSQLFDGAQKRLTILVGRRATLKDTTVYTTQYFRWKREEFNSLFPSRIQYAPPHPNFSVFPAALEKLGSRLEIDTFNRLATVREKLVSAIPGKTRYRVYYTRKFGYFLAFLDFIPQIVESKTSQLVPPSELKDLELGSSESVYAVVAALSSSTFFWFWNVLSDCRNLNRRDLLAFPFDPENVQNDVKQQLVNIGKRYLIKLKETSLFMTKSGLKIETFEYANCKPVLDEIDRILARHYGFTEEELDFIINYDIKYRMGRDSIEEEK